MCVYGENFAGILIYGFYFSPQKGLFVAACTEQLQHTRATFVFFLINLVTVCAFLSSFL